MIPRTFVTQCHEISLHTCGTCFSEGLGVHTVQIKMPQKWKCSGIDNKPSKYDSYGQISTSTARIQTRLDGCPFRIATDLANAVIQNTSANVLPCFWLFWHYAHSYPNFNDGLTKPPFKLGHEWVITYYINQLLYFLIHALISVKLY